MHGIAILHKYYNKSIGYKSELLGKINLLSPGGNIDLFKIFFDSPRSIKKLGNYKKYIFIDENFYLQTLVDYNGKVLAFSITTRRKDFNPRLEIRPPYTANGKIIIELGKTKFNELDELSKINFRQPKKIIFKSNSFFYGEEHYLDRDYPDNYQSCIFGSSQDGYIEVKKEEYKNINNSKLIKFRKNEVINTYVVKSSSLRLKSLLDKEVFSLFFIGP
jgi:hypothetical protein